MIDEMLVIQDHEVDCLKMINGWLPPSIVDSHVHCSPPIGNQTAINAAAVSPTFTFNFFPWEMHVTMMARIFRRIDWRLVTFGLPTSESDRRDNNYLCLVSKSDKRLRPVLMATTTKDPAYVQSGLSQEFHGLKMYPTFEQKQKPTRIVDVFPKKVLAIVDKLSSTIVLHLPGNILTNLDEFLRLARNFSRIRFILAHMGNMHCYHPDYSNALMQIRNFPNVFLDTAMIDDSEVLAEGIATLGWHRVLFGSDAPFSYIRGKYVQNQTGQARLHSQLEFGWVDKAEWQTYKDQVGSFRLMYINVILAIKQAIEQLGLRSQEAEIKQRIFLTNAADIL